VRALDRARAHLGESVDGASLHAFRIGLGLLWTFAAVRFVAYGWVEELYLAPSYHFAWVSWAVVPPATVLYGLFREWKGVPYRYGGTTKQGIDCSAFVAHTFRHGLGVELPRTVSAQSQRGQRIDRDELSMGDLLFFRTGRSSEHVGIYLQRGEFMHASRRRGVMISRLSNRYWRAKFVQARRVLE